MYRTYRDRAVFLMIYIKEAHPQDGWQAAKNTKTGVVYNQPKTAEERGKIAHACRTTLQLDIPFVLDTIDNQVDGVYAGFPERIYIVNQEGRIHYKGGIGPEGFKPLEAEASLKELLSEK